MYPRYAEKVPCRYRSASSLAFSTMPCESWAGRAGLHGLDGRSRVSGSAAFVHSCPPNVTLLPCNGIQAFAAARLCQGVHGCEWRGREELAHPGLVCMHGRVASLGSIILLHTRLSTAPHFRQPSGPARRLSQLTLAWCCVFVPYLIIPPPHYSCCPLFYYCYDYRDLLFFILVPVLPLLLACLPACLLAVVGSSQLLLPRQKVKSNIASHRIRTPAGASETPASLIIGTRSRSLLPALDFYFLSSSSPLSAHDFFHRLAGIDLLRSTRPLLHLHSPPTITSGPTRRLSSVAQQHRLPLTFCIFL